MVERDAGSVLRGLLSPLSAGEEVAGGAVLDRVSTELGLRILLDRGGQTLHIHVEPLAHSKRYAAASTHFAFSYREAQIDEAEGIALCRRIADLVAVNEEAVLKQLEGVAAGTVDAPRIRHVEVERLLEPAGDDDERYYTLSPYVGCLIGCRFCYAQSHLAGWRSLVGLPEAPWGSYVEVRDNAPEVLQRELRDAASVPIKFCPIVSDPYHAVEKGERLTRRCLEVILGAPPRDVLVLTRGALVRRDFDLLGAMGAHLGVSLPTVDDEVRRHFEPRGASIEDRLALLRDAKAAGARPFAVVQPLLPGSLGALVDALADVVTSARVDVLRGAYGAEAEFADARYAAARKDAWQADRAAELVSALEERGVAVWSSELPPPGV